MDVDEETHPVLEKVSLMIKEGPISGIIEKTEVGDFYCFNGIPYAKPPLGKLRFLPPVPIPPWEEEIICTRKKLQKTCMVCEWYGLEDCLYINVKTKCLHPKKPLPVMFWIGSYDYSFIMDFIFDSSLLVDEDVIFVSCGFRLGPFGFLSINDVIAPGNVGLKDIALALKWVQRNIATFGGDPNNVTIFGSSSGGAMVHLMMLSTMTTGLFHKAVIQSACALNNWAVTKNPTKPVLDLAKELGLDLKCKIEIVEKLKTLSEEEIMKAYDKMHQDALHVESNVFNPLFKPCIEEQFEGQAAFLTKSPALIVKSGNFNKVPVIIGSNNIEALVLQFIKCEHGAYKMYNENKRFLIPKTLAQELNMSKTIAQQVMNFYIGEEDNLQEDKEGNYLQLCSDYYFLYYINKTVGLHSQFNAECPVYYYIFNYSGDWSVPQDWMEMFNSIGHTAELPYMFRIETPGQQACASAGRDTLTVRERVVRLWTNFAKYGNPTPDENDPLLQITWDPVESKDRLNYLSIGAELTKGRNPFRERMSFWDKLHNEHTFLRTLIYFDDMGVQW